MAVESRDTWPTRLVVHEVLDQGLVQATRQGALRELGKGAGVRSPRWAARGDSATRTGAGPPAASEPLAPPAVGG